MFLLAVFMFGGAYLRCNKSIVEKLLVKIVPPPLPPHFCVYASGVCELICGLFLLFNLVYPSSPYNTIGGSCVVLLLWAVFPANLYHALSQKAQKDTKISAPGVLYARVVIQFLFLGWAGWHADLATLNQFYIYA